MNDDDSELTILVTGGGGQLGQEFVEMIPNGLWIVVLDRTHLDITHAEQCKEVIYRYKPDTVIHVAAYTAVDRAEAEPETAWSINVEGTRNVAEVAESVGAKLV